MKTPALPGSWAVAGAACAKVRLLSLPLCMALFASVLALSSLAKLIPTATTIGEMVTRGSYIVVFLLVFMANPRGESTSSRYLTQLTVLGIVALVVNIRNQFVLGSIFRARRLLG